MLFAGLGVTLSSVGSNVEFSALEHNFGRVAEWGGDVSCHFVVRNRSDRAVVIQRVSTTCSCLVARYSRKPIAPNGSDTLHVKFDPRFKAGLLRRVVSVEISSDSIAVQLMVAGEVY